MNETGIEENAAWAPASITELVLELRDGDGSERMSLGEVAEGLGGRAHGLLLVVLALPETIPMIGLSVILGAPIFVIGVYMAFHGADVPIPGWIRRRSLKRARIETAIDRTIPAFRWLDRFIRPRWPVVAGAARLQGVVCVAMAILLAIPFPGVNILAAFGVAGVGLGVLQRDGLIIAGAFVSSLLAVAASIAVVTGVLALAG